MCEIGTMHERVATPPTCTVHAPHALMPQPNFVPVIFRSSRNTQSSGVEGSTFTSRCCPFTVKLKVAIVLELQKSGIYLDTVSTTCGSGWVSDQVYETSAN